MSYLLFSPLYLLIAETFIELMIKAMDMELLDWTEITPWKSSKLILMAVILGYQAFFRWTPFLVVSKFNSKEGDNYSSSIKVRNMPWFFFGNFFHVMLMSVFGFVSWKLNPNAWLFYGLLLIASAEIIVFLIIGISARLFCVRMGKNIILVSNGKLITIPFNQLQRIEKKYEDEIYFIRKNGTVETLNYKIFSNEERKEFLEKLKRNSDNHNVYFPNDLN